MRKIFAVLVTASVLAVAGVGIADPPEGDRGNACPESSQNPGGTPPNCGHPPEVLPTGCAEDGPVSGIVRGVEDVDPTGGHAGSPSEGGVVHMVNCGLIDETLGL